MFIDLLTSSNYITVNIGAIKIFGLNIAVYCSELLNIYKKAYNKKKLIAENYFKLDRKYMTDQTSLSVEDQLKADANLIKIGIITKDSADPDIIKFDFESYASIISSEDVVTIKHISSEVKIKSPRGVRQSQRQRIINELKNSIVCSDYELLTALRDWVDSIFANPVAYLSKKMIEIFQQTLNTYTKGDLDLALRIVKIATVQSYRDCQWAINLYEKDKQYKEKQVINMKERLPRVTEQIKATSDTIDNKTQF